MQPEILISTLHDAIGQELAGHADAAGAAVTSASAIFTALFTRYMVEASLTSGPQICIYDGVSESGRVRLDGYALSADSEQLDLFVSLYKGSPGMQAINQMEILAALGETRRFLELCISGSLASCACPDNTAVIPFTRTCPDLRDHGCGGSLPACSIVFHFRAGSRVRSYRCQCTVYGAAR
jgi:hypothetical protein